jgi:hypothetical protein
MSPDVDFLVGGETSQGVQGFVLAIIEALSG